MSVEGKGFSMFDCLRDTGKLFWVRPYNQCEKFAHFTLGTTRVKYAS